MPALEALLRTASSIGRELLDELLGVKVLPLPLDVASRELLVEAHEVVDEFAAHGCSLQYLRKLREVDEPIRIPRCPIGVIAVDDPVHLMMGLRCLVQKIAHVLSTRIHVSSSPPGWPIVPRPTHRRADFRSEYVRVHRDLREETNECRRGGGCPPNGVHPRIAPFETLLRPPDGGAKKPEGGWKKGGSQPARHETEVDEFPDALLCAR